MTRTVAALADAIDAELPQTQCGRCGYAGCRPYADAIARGRAAINRCPPGGREGVRAISRVTGLPELPLDPACGPAKPRAVAAIDETSCIGCTLCVEACPVDAIVGAARQLHTVLAASCTGCELCLPPCPVDCIAMEPLTAQPARAELLALAHDARLRHQRRTERLAHGSASAGTARESRHDAVGRAVARARARLAAKT